MAAETGSVSLAYTDEEVLDLDLNEDKIELLENSGKLRNYLRIPILSQKSEILKGLW